MRSNFQSRSKTVHAPTDLVTDTALLLQQAGVHQINRAQLDKIIHEEIDCQDLVDRAQRMFSERRFQGLITLDGLLGAAQAGAA